MLNAIRNKLAAIIAPATKQTAIQLPGLDKDYKGPKTLTIPQDVGTRRVPQIENTAPIGKFTVEHLELIQSQYYRDAIASLGAWSALASAFNAFVKMKAGRNTEANYEQQREQFHAWNAACSIDRQMGEDQVLEAVAKMATATVKEGRPENLKIIADALDKSIDEIKADRVKRAQKKAAEKKAQLVAFVADIWEFTGAPVSAWISSTKAAQKGIQTLNFIDEYWEDETAAACEMLLVRHDMKTIEALARKEEDHEGEGQAEVGLGKEKPEYDGDPLKKRRTLDTQAFEDWEAQQHADQ